MRLLSGCLLLILLISCGSREGFVGTYKTEAGGSPTPVETVMELKANGEGTWRVNDEDVPFAWYIKGGELRIHTKGGGVIVGATEKDTIQITAPGAGTLLFRRVP
jgi:hypothetical protein